MPTSASGEMRHGGALQIQAIRRAFGSIVALKEVSIDVRAGEFFSLLGPSGCGKTTLLRIIAGLDDPDAGAVLLDGENLLQRPAHERPVNTVFQSYALFPHLSVGENIGFGLRMKKVNPSEINRRVNAMMELVEVQKLAARRPHELSGGQRQRIALARALVNEPSVLLLDEPLAAVDQKLRKQLQDDLVALQRRLGLTFIYVTHDQEEALSLSDRLAVMNHGEVEQIGVPQEVYDHPKTRFVAEFLGSSNLIDAEVSNGIARTIFGEFRLANSNTNGKATLFFRPEKVILGSGPFRGIVNEVTFAGIAKHITIRMGNTSIRATALNQDQRSVALETEILWDVRTEAITLIGHK